MRRETLGVTLMVAGVFVAYAWSGRYWIDVVDEGYFLDLSERVLHGALPYRDFATYYTPGVFYLFALTFKLFGTGILPIRLLMAGLRGLCALLLYGLTRRVAPWWLAWVPFGLVAALDHWPIEPEPHPSWLAMIAMLLTMDLVARHLATGRLRWLVLAGVAAGAAFLFKQNVGAFAALGLMAYVVLRPRVCAVRPTACGGVADVPIRPAGWLRWVFGVCIGLAVTALLWPGRDTGVVFVLWLPLVVVLAIVLGLGTPSVGARGVTLGLSTPSAEALGGELLAAGGALVVTIAAWLVPLVIALGPGQTPFGLFLGITVDQSALAIPFAPIWPVAFDTWHLYLPALAAWAGVIAVLRCRSPVLGWYLLFGTLGALNMYPRADTLHALVSGLPLLVTGVGALALLGGSHRLAASPATQGSMRMRLAPVPVALPGRLRTWLAPASTALSARLSTKFAYRGTALPEKLRRLIAQPSMALPARLRRWLAPAHVALPESLCSRFAPASTALPGRLPTWLAAAHMALPESLRTRFPHGIVALPGRLRRRIARAVARGAVIALLAAAVAPQVVWRYTTLVTAGPYAPLGAMRVPEEVVQDTRGVIDFVQAGTPPGESLFVYPAAPLLNFLAKRPNPTRFDHFLPGTLTTADLQVTIQQLDQARPRYVIWDHRGVVVWQTDPANRLLSDYIWSCYRQVTAFGLYLVLERNADAC